MNMNTKITSIVLAGLLSASPLISAVHANEIDKGTDAVSKAVTESKENAIVKTVDEAFKALREVRAARLAIFNGSTDSANEFVNQAEKNLEAMQAHVKAFAIKTNSSENKKDAYIPFDMTLMLSEGFVATEEKQPKLEEANGHLAKGEHAKAVEVLKLANIDVNVSTAMIPATASLNHVKDAVKLMSEKKFYEANIALKALEDSVIIESFGISEVPVQGTS